MKSLLLFILMVFAVLCNASAQNDAMFVYRNDGQFNIFLKSDIDSIRYSPIDLDSLVHKEFVVQEVWTQDSVCRIPLIAIDSVGFVKPATTFQPDVVVLDGDLRATLLSVDEGKLLFSKNSKESHYFEIGDKLVALEMSELLPIGFMGQVVDIEAQDDNILITCQDVDMEEVFYSYCSLINSVSNDSSNKPGQPNYAKSAYLTFSLPKMTYSWELAGNFDILPDTQFGGSASVSSSFSPKLILKGCDMIDPERGHITDITISGKIEIENGYDFSIGVSSRKEISFFPIGKEFEAPIAPFLSFFLDAGLFMEGSANISLSQNMSVAYKNSFNIKRIGDVILPPEPILKEVNRSVSEYQLALKGRAAAGVYMEMGIKPWIISKDALGKISLSEDIGVEFETTKGFDFADLKQASFTTALYDAVNIADGGLQPNLYGGFYHAPKFNWRMSPFEYNFTFGKQAIGVPIYQGSLFPHFSSLSYTNTTYSNEINTKCNISGSCPFDYEVGFSIFDSEGGRINTLYYPTPYFANPFMRFDEYDMDISEVYKGKKYVVYPCIKVFGFDVLASPSLEIFNQDTGEITDFRQTFSDYSSEGFDYEGRNYAFKFDVALTAQISNLEGVDDWGYVYKDPNGNIKRISLMEFGSSYTDTRYAYYRNNPQSTVCLYTYVKYEGIAEYFYGNPHDYPLVYSLQVCPDDNHPHDIDLGLPSGTLWSCCNVGATSPEEDGSAFRFLDIPPAPTKEQIEELIECTTHEFIKFNGVSGCLFRGINNNKLFLPCARGYHLSHSDGTPSPFGGGVYWSSSIDYNTPTNGEYLNVYLLCISPGYQTVKCASDKRGCYTLWDGCYECFQYPVRPVY